MCWCYAGDLWFRTVAGSPSEYPQVTVGYLHVDAATIHLVTDPGRFDVIVTDNLFGDIITDLAAAVAGGIGLAASGNLNLAGTAPSMFEPVHGSAPDIAGQGIADPTAAILSVAMLLAHLGHAGEAARVEAAVAGDLAARDQRQPGKTARSATGSPPASDPGRQAERPRAAPIVRPLAARCTGAGAVDDALRLIHILIRGGAAAGGRGTLAGWTPPSG